MTARMEGAIDQLRYALGGEYQNGYWDHEAIEHAAKILLSVRELFLHDGGPGSLDYNASRLYEARKDVRNLLGMYPTETGTFGK